LAIFIPVAEAASCFEIGTREFVRPKRTIDG
jgi:hypothetical protein